MKLVLKKKAVIDLSKKAVIPAQQTPNIGGGDTRTAPWMCQFSYPVCYTSPQIPCA